MDIIKEGSQWQVRDGWSIMVAKDDWLPHALPKRTFTGHEGMRTNS